MAQCTLQATLTLPTPSTEWVKVVGRKRGLDRLNALRPSQFTSE